MGTRCLTHFESDGKILCTVYSQMDGYPDGHGQELADFLSGFKVVNGIGGDDEMNYPKLANGLGCLAAQTIAHLKRQDPREAQRRNDMLKHFAESYPNKSGFKNKKEYLKRDYRVGSIYMTTPGETDAWQDYTYTVYIKSLGPDSTHPFNKEALELRMRCETDLTTDRKDGTKKIVVMFDGKPEDFDAAAASEVSEKDYEEIYGKDE